MADAVDISAFAPGCPPFGVIYGGVHDGELKFNFYCKACGGWVLTTDDQPATDMSMMFCKACGEFFGRLSMIWATAVLAGEAAGLPVPRRIDASTWSPP